MTMAGDEGRAAHLLFLRFSLASVFSSELAGRRGNGASANGEPASQLHGPWLAVFIRAGWASGEHLGCEKQTCLSSLVPASLLEWSPTAAARH